MSPKLGGREVVILDKGFIFVGNTEETDSGLWIRNASNIRRWKRGGLGGMILDPKRSETFLDKSTDLFVPTHAVLQRHPVSESWGR